MWKSELAGFVPSALRFVGLFASLHSLSSPHLNFECFSAPHFPSYLFQCLFLFTCWCPLCSWFWPELSFLASFSIALVLLCFYFFLLQFPLTLLSLIYYYFACFIFLNKKSPHFDYVIKAVKQNLYGFVASLSITLWLKNFWKEPLCVKNILVAENFLGSSLAVCSLWQKEFCVIIGKNVGGEEFRFYQSQFLSWP